MCISETEKTSSDVQIYKLKHLVDKRDQRKLIRLVQTAREDKVTEIVTLHNHGEQKSSQ